MLLALSAGENSRAGTGMPGLSSPLLPAPGTSWRSIGTRLGGKPGLEQGLLCAECGVTAFVCPMMGPRGRKYSPEGDTESWGAASQLLMVTEGPSGHRWAR